jgi:hypothetical protein
MGSRHDTLHPVAQQMAPGARGILPSTTPESAIQRIPLDWLGFPPAGRRRISSKSIHALADRMLANGQIQSLMVVPGEALNTGLWPAIAASRLCGCSPDKDGSPQPSVFRAG